MGLSPGGGLVGGGGGGAGGAAISAGASSQNSGTVVFSNSNSVSFGLSNGVVTASIAPGAAAGLAAVSAGTQSQTSGTLVFSNSNGVSFGLSGSSQLTASVIQGLRLSGGAGTSNTAVTGLTFSNANGMTFGVSTGAGVATVTGSYTVPSTAGLISGMRLSAGGGTSNTAVTGLTFSNGNGITFGLSTGASVGTVTASYNSTQFAGLGTTFAGANISGSLTLNTAGLDMSVSVPATSLLSAGAGISISLNGSTIIIMTV